jgi:hypothetical protein
MYYREVETVPGAKRRADEANRGIAKTRLAIVSAKRSQRKAALKELAKLAAT